METSFLIWHSTSVDGRVWSAPRVVVPQARRLFSSFRVAADQTGRLHVLYHESAGSSFPGEPPFRGFYVRWDGATWSLPEQLLNWEEVGWVIGTTVDPLDSLHITAQVRDFGASNELYHASAYVGR